MVHEQLYYPNLVPRITSRLAISFLHWDRVVRIFPQKGTAKFPRSHGIIKDLEDEKILVSESLEYIDIHKATTLFERLMSIVKNPKKSQHSIAKSLVRPLPRFRRGEYYIYRGKILFNKAYREYFRSGTDCNGNEIFFCTKQTGLTYMTLLAYFLNERKRYANMITDQTDAFPLFIALNRLLRFSSSRHSVDFVPIVEAANQVERIFFIPLLRVLEPVNFDDEKTIEKILTFRKDPSNEDLRKKYLERIDSFLVDLHKCYTDKDVKEVANKHQQDFRRHLQILIAACEAHGIPVNKKIISYGKLNGWVIGGHLWDATCNVIDIVTNNALSIVKASLNFKPSLDFYNKVLKRTDSFYPLLIQETFSPTFMQRLFDRIRQLDRIEIPSIKRILS